VHGIQKKQDLRFAFNRDLLAEIEEGLQKLFTIGKRRKLWT
jgi:hypothetical protein